MKSKATLLRRISVFALSLIFVTSTAFAEGESENAYMTGTTYTAAGDFVMNQTDEIFHYQGGEYQVFEVFYDDPGHNVRLAVPTDDKCKCLIAYTDDTWFFYNCSKEGFGIRKVLFTSQSLMEQYSAEEYQEQSILMKKRNTIDRDVALGLVASYLPRLKG